MAQAQAGYVTEMQAAETGLVTVEVGNSGLIAYSQDYYDYYDHLAAADLTRATREDSANLIRIGAIKSAAIDQATAIGAAQIKAAQDEATADTKAVVDITSADATEVSDEVTAENTETDKVQAALRQQAADLGGANRALVTGVDSALDLFRGAASAPQANYVTSTAGITADYQIHTAQNTADTANAASAVSGTQKDFLTAKYDQEQVAWLTAMKPHFVLYQQQLAAADAAADSTPQDEVVDQQEADHAASLLSEEADAEATQTESDTAAEGQLAKSEAASSAKRVAAEAAAQGAFSIAAAQAAAKSALASVTEALAYARRRPLIRKPRAKPIFRPMPPSFTMSPRAITPRLVTRLAEEPRARPSKRIQPILATTPRPTTRKSPS